jgi:diguanylate cyclase (GGDEF)-like protein
VPTADGVKRAIVHFEVTVESFRKEARARSDRTLLVVDAKTGAVVVNSTRPQQVGAALGDPDDNRFIGLVGRWGETGQLDLAGFQAAYRRVGAKSGNANEWYAVTVADRPSGVMTGVGALPPIVVLAALLLLTFAVIGLRREQSALVSAANTDALTGLNNRRKLVNDLNNQLANVTRDDPLLLILCDLNGFKAYNDTFGHPVGDVLLARLGATLAAAVAGRGHAYRIGGDEFCVLARPCQGSIEEIVQLAACALTEHGDGFSITTAHGAILLPTEAATASEAMRAVDLRMYEQKNAGRVPADTQTINALVRAMHERDQGLVERLTMTAELAGRVCQALGLPSTEEARIRRAAQLHDVGKVAVPDDILHKPGPLDPAEWAFVQQCPSISERITAAAPALAPLASLIRSARERYDGTGYPDRLAGNDIPLGARIIAVCAAVAAMISDRAHAKSRDLAAALEEVRQGSGTQFDPQVVEAVLDAIRERTPAG